MKNVNENFSMGDFNQLFKQINKENFYWIIFFVIY